MSHCGHLSSNGMNQRVDMCYCLESQNFSFLTGAHTSENYVDSSRMRLRHLIMNRCLRKTRYLEYKSTNLKKFLKQENLEF